MDTALLVSLFILIILIAFVLWWYGVKRPGPAGAPARRDKLTLISGIGPTLEQKLNELGITRFQQIAEFTQEDIDRVDKVLAFKGRIQREEWVAQARQLAAAGPRSTLASGKIGTDKGHRKTVRTKVYRKKAAIKKKTGQSTSSRRV